MTVYRTETVQVDTPMLGAGIDDATDSVDTSTVIIGADELEANLYAEATMHVAAGWSVRQSEHFVVAAKVRAEDMTLVVRVIYHVAFDPADDGDAELKAVL